MRLFLLLPLLLASCLRPLATESTQASGPASAPTWRYVPDLPVSSPPFQQVHANWKQRLEQPYVYVEYVGAYTETGRLLPALIESLRELGIEPAGPPFGLFYDDPGRVPTERLRSRACVPVEGSVQVSEPLAFEVLPSVTVAYAVASGPYPEVPRCYAGVYRFLDRMGWVENGPVREIYLVSPSAVQSWDELLCEVQIPVTYSR